ncbi:peptidase, U32 family [Candidatus Magnetoovum chiemensis]|nr:peptidase, U32 family [Candidatus Magnetoovum chiemensis]
MQKSIDEQSSSLLLQHACGNPNTMAKPELLAPAGDFEKLKTALHYGADAVYLGSAAFSLRAMAGNFTSDEIKNAVEYTHNVKKKVYVTINIFPHNKDLTAIKEHIEELKELKPDGFIISDIGVISLAKEIAPEIPIHVSTQANITNVQAAKVYEKLGAKRLVLSRELTIDEIKQIRDGVSLELECFIHGSICISYSGRCYISSFLANRSANKGECTNSCRWNYTLMEEKRQGEYMPVYEDDRGTYIMSSRDLCMIEHLDKLYRAGVNSFKIEGRTKGINYISGVVKTYKDALDSLINDNPYTVKQQWLDELSMFSSRGFTTAMYLGKQSDTDYNHDEQQIYKKSRELLGIVKSTKDGEATVLLRNSLNVGDEAEFLIKGKEITLFKITWMKDIDGEDITYARNDDIVSIPVPEEANKNDIIRRCRPQIK